MALWTVSLIGILFGATLLRGIPKHRVHRAAALMFVIFGVLALGQVVLEHVDALERDPASYKELLLSDALEMPKSA